MKLHTILAAAVICIQTIGASAAMTGIYEHNGHWYQGVSLDTGALSWDEAKTLAENAVYNGMHGHLATITDNTENSTLVYQLLRPNGITTAWFGGFCNNTGWHWVTGETWGPYNNFDSGVGQISGRATQFISNTPFWGAGYGTGGAYVIEWEPSTAVVPEPTTLIAGAFLLLPLAAGTILRFRKTGQI